MTYFKAHADGNRSRTWYVTAPDGRVILRGVPGAYARDVARDCNADARAAAVWTRGA